MLAGGIKEEILQHFRLGAGAGGGEETGCFRNKAALGWISSYVQAKDRGKIKQAKTRQQDESTSSRTDGKTRLMHKPMLLS